MNYFEITIETIGVNLKGIVIEPSASLPCIRFIVALHDKQRIQTPILRRSSAELAIEGFKKEGTGLAHIRLLLLYAENPLPGVTAERGLWRVPSGIRMGASLFKCLSRV
ncbi:MAG: hypothetical protein M5U34_27890 [Chloroflexi bacterium]|nr:hypothetical protein [Chloroflexota bacterium]